MRCALAFLLLSVATTALTHAGTTGNLAGYVRDALHGMPIANAEVCYTSQVEGKHCMSTDAHGFYVFLSLSPARASVTVEKQGFQWGYILVNVDSDTTNRRTFNLFPYLVGADGRPPLIPPELVNPGQVLDAHVIPAQLLDVPGTLLPSQTPPNG